LPQAVAVGMKFGQVFLKRRNWAPVTPCFQHEPGRVGFVEMPMIFG
jgi:hypothetical protein